LIYVLAGEREKDINTGKQERKEGSCMKKLYSKPAMELLDLTVRERVAACVELPTFDGMVKAPPFGEFYLPCGGGKKWELNTGIC
jgi:hypothetical protein